MSIAQVALLGVIAFGFVAVGCIVLVGPVFIPFFLVPKLDWIFWGWFKALLQYSFYPGVCECVRVLVFGQIWLNFFSQNGFAGTVEQIAGLFVQFVILVDHVFMFGNAAGSEARFECISPGSRGNTPCPASDGGDKHMVTRTHIYRGRRHTKTRRRASRRVIAQPQIMRNYFAAGMLATSLLSLGLLVLNFRTQAQQRERLVVRIDDVGRAQAVGYSSLEYKPQAAEIKYFLTQFVHDYYGREIGPRYAMTFAVHGVSQLATGGGADGGGAQDESH